MIVRYLLAALAAGLLAGILMTPVQMRQVVPILLHAEQFEGAAPHDHAAGAAAHAHVEAVGPVSEEKPLLLGRFWNTVFANLVTGAGFALLMTGVSLVTGVSIRFSTGLAWGAAGWLAVQFLPGIGLPPELPGFPYVDLQARQYWWIAAVAASIVGLALCSCAGKTSRAPPALRCCLRRIFTARRSRRILHPMSRRILPLNMSWRRFQRHCSSGWRLALSLASSWTAAGKPRERAAQNILVIGGARSGKSAFAEELAAKSGLAKIYVATGQAFDREMSDRIDIHKARRGPEWENVEDPFDLTGVLKDAAGGRKGGAGGLPDTLGHQFDA